MKKLLCLAALAAALSATLPAHAGSFDDYFRAVHGDNPGAVRNLLNRGFDPNTRDERGQTGLLIALREPSPKVIDVLLSSPQTDVNARNASDESALMLAAIKGQSDLVDKLLARDAAVNKPGWTPLHYAASSGQLSIMKTLLDKYAFIDAQSPNGTTPLMMAAMYGSAESVKLLLDEGADPLMKNELGMTALNFAQQGKRPDAVEMLTAAVRAKQPGAGKW
jgi:ankyrin repeat protein